MLITLKMLFLHRLLFNLILFIMVYFRVELTDPSGLVVFSKTFCSHSDARKCFDKHLISCDSNYAVLMTAYSLREDLDHFDLQDLPF